MNILAIDLGKNGTIVLGKYETKRLIEILKMPDTLNSLYTNMARLMKESSVIVIEDVGHSIAGNSAKSAYTFAVHRGHMEMCITAINLIEELAVPVHWVRPQKWMKEFGVPSGLERNIRKNIIFEKVLKSNLGLDFCKYSADAIAIFLWYVNNINKTITEQRKGGEISQ